MQLLSLYLSLITWVSLGFFLGRILSARVVYHLGIGLFWVGVPLGIAIFLRQADLTGAIWLAPVVCWFAVLLGAAIALSWICFTKQLQPKAHGKSWQMPTQGSFLNAAMFGNTGYLGYPIVLALVGPQYFGWAVFYDTLGTTLAAYGLGVALAAHFGKNSAPQNQLSPIWRITGALIKNPALFGFFAGFSLRTIEFSAPIEESLKAIAWTVIAISLMLIGMRLSQMSSHAHLQTVVISLGIKMLLVPFIVALGLSLLGITGFPRLVLVLQAAMPPAFATFIIAEAYQLDCELSVTTLALGTIGVLFTLPIWIFLFG